MRGQTIKTPWIVLLLSAVLLVACGKDESAKKKKRPRTAVKVDEAPDIRIDGDAAHFYRYFPPGERKAAGTKTLADIPEESRAMVLVVPDPPPPAGVFYVANLTQAGEDGAYPYEKLTQSAWQQRVTAFLGPAPEAPPAVATSPDRPKAGPAAKKDEVIMFSASWCGVCTQARRWFYNKGIEYVEKDIETTPGARKEMQERAQRAGLSPQQLSGVPVIWVNGRMFPGFDPNKIQAALDG